MVTPTPVVSAAVTLPGGTRYRIEAEFSLGSVTAPNLEVGVTTASGIAVSRRLPLPATRMPCMIQGVHNPDTQQVEYVLGNDNLYTRYEYNRARCAQQKHTRKPFSTAARKLISETKEDFRRFHIDQ